VQHREKPPLLTRIPPQMRPGNGFSKKLENMKAAVSLHFANYNFVRQHKTLRMTPAMAAGVERSMWSLHELVERTT